MTAPFLTVIERHLASRPQMWQQHEQSIALQADLDLDRLVLVDTVGMGVVWANAQLAKPYEQIHGQYVLVLDDDDVLTGRGVTSALKEAAATRPGVVVFKVNHGGCLGILPDDMVWGKDPVWSHIGGSSVLVRRDLWFKHCHHWAGGCYEADIDFLTAVWADNPEIVWLDKVLIRCLRISRGRPE